VFTGWPFSAALYAEATAEAIKPSFLVGEDLVTAKAV